MKSGIVGLRKVWYSISAVLVVLSLFFIYKFGLNLGIDFVGGTQIEVETSISDKQKVQEVFVDIIGNEKGEKIIKILGKDGYIIKSKYLSDEELTKFRNAVGTSNESINIIKISTIGPSVGETFKNRAIIAVVLSIVAIIVFIFVAFSKIPKELSSLKFGFIAIIALLHDILIIIGVFAFMGIFINAELNSLFITSLLTVLGFSINDTIVIFDRIRENLQKAGNNYCLSEIANKSIKDSIRRSINTSLSTLIIIFFMIFFLYNGFVDLFLFFVSLACGIVVGTYSSIFLATPLVVDFHKKSK